MQELGHFHLELYCVDVPMWGENSQFAKHKGAFTQPVMETSIPRYYMFLKKRGLRTGMTELNKNGISAAANMDIQ